MLARLVPLAVIAVGLLAACTSEMVDPEAPDEPLVGETFDERLCPDDSDLAWEHFGGPFMYGWCNGCHAAALPEGERQKAPMGIDFDTVEDVRHWADRIWARAGDHNATMPPVGGPDDVEREMLGEWLACGSPTLEIME